MVTFYVFLQEILRPKKLVAATIDVALRIMIDAPRAAAVEIDSLANKPIQDAVGQREDDVTFRFLSVAFMKLIIGLPILALTFTITQRVPRVDEKSRVIIR